MSKPVEIEFLMRDNLSPGLNKAAEAMRRLSGDAEAGLREITASITEQRKYIKRLEGDLKELKKAYKAAAPGAAEAEARARYNAKKRELDEEKAALNGLIAQQAELKEAARGSGDSLRLQLRNVTQEIATLKIAYAELSDAGWLEFSFPQLGLEFLKYVDSGRFWPQMYL